MYPRISMSSQQQARMDMTALMCARFIELGTGNQEPFMESMQSLLHDPERMAGALVTVVNLLAAYVSDNGSNMGQFQKFNDFLIGQLKKDEGPIRRLDIGR
jgi:hypothetical protein